MTGIDRQIARRPALGIDFGGVVMPMVRGREELGSRFMAAEPNPGAFVAAEPCNDGAAQQFDVQADGRIVPEAAPDLCLTMGTDSVPGGGGDPIHLIRKLSFETCTDDAAERQQWEFRTRFEGYDTPVYERPSD